MNEPLVQISWSSLTAIAGFIITLWLGCYLITHTTQSRVAWLTIFTLLSLAGYFLHAVLCLHVPAVQAGFLWRRFLGWFAIPALPLWLNVTIELLPADIARRQRWLLWSAYTFALVLIGLWLFGAWTFSTNSLVPLELAPPLSVFGVIITLSALANLWYAQHLARDPVLRQRRRLLWLVTFVGALGSVYLPLATLWWAPPWAPSTTLAWGHSFLSLGLLLLAYAIVRHNAFMAGRWIGRDFAYHLFAIAVLVVLYTAAVAGAWFLALALHFDALMLILVIVTGMVIATHLLADWARGVWDAVFFRELRPLRVEMRTLAQEMARPVQPEQQMQELVESLAHLTGSVLVCLALDEGEGLVIRAATRKERSGQKVNVQAGAPPEGFALVEPIRLFDKQAGYLLLGEKGVGEGYNRQERIWITAFAAHLSALLDQARLREEATQRLAAVAEEVAEIQSQEVALHQEMQRVLAGGPIAIDRRELGEALHCYSHPERLADLINREGSTLAGLAAVAQAGPRRVQALQRVLAGAVDTLRPPEGLPSLEALRDRPLRKKGRRHLPSTVADYYTTRLIMDGYTFEAVAEQLNVSPRQAHNYLERAVTRLLGMLEVSGPSS